MGGRRIAAIATLASLLLIAAPAGAAPAGAAPCSGTFQVLNSDRIGSLKLPAGPYVITPAGGVGCQQAAVLFSRFLQDWDGILPNGWKVSGSGFVKQGSAAAFTVKRASAPPPVPPAGASGPICPGAFTLTVSQRIASLSLRAGNYAIQLLSTSTALTCAAASRQLSVFLEEEGAPLPSPWTLETKTSTFTRSAGVGFRIIVAGSSTGGGGRTEGVTCRGTFQVVHNDRINSLRVPAGRYYLYALGDIGCVEVVNRFRSFLQANGIPRKNWSLNAQTATFLYQGNRGFRVEPVSGV